MPKVEPGVLGVLVVLAGQEVLGGEELLLRVIQHLELALVPSPARLVLVEVKLLPRAMVGLLWTERWRPVWLEQVVGVGQ